jgi:tRNA uridine 5-carboxymethylaminomethyl modification enzyme
VDDLVTRGVSEPYRMFTSRAEYRLQLREDNADLRLTETGRRLGLVDDARWTAFSRKREAIERETARLKAAWARPARIPAEEQVRVLGAPLECERSLFELLRRPEVRYQALSKWAESDGADVDPAVAQQVEIAAKYAGYIERQQVEIDRQRAHDGTPLPPQLDYAGIRGLSKEVRQKLEQHRPETVGQASRIQGMTPAAISLLLVHLKRRAASPEPPPQERRA